MRDQGPSGQRDGHDQTGTYLVFKLGDRGEIGIWQRDQTRWLTFQVNGEMVADLIYDKLPMSGGLGIFVGGDLNVVALERLRIDNAQIDNTQKVGLIAEA